MTSLNISTMSGADLDEWAKKWGLIRRYNETDSQLDHRIRSTNADDGIIDFSEVEIDLPSGIVKGTPLENNGNKEIPDLRGYYMREKKCECGSAKLGYTQPGPGHASYCPLITK